MTLPEAIRRGRFFQDLTQEELGLRTGLARNSIVNIEHGRTDPSFSNAKKIAAVLEFSLDSLTLE